MITFFFAFKFSIFEHLSIFFLFPFIIGRIEHNKEREMIPTIPSTLNCQRMTVERVERVKNSDTIEFGLGYYSSLSDFVNY